MPATSRREFARSVAVLAVTAPLAQACAAASPAPTVAPPPVPNVPAAPAGEAETLFALIRERYGAGLDAEQLAAVERSVQSVVRSAERLRAVKLDTGVGPACDLGYYRGIGMGMGIAEGEGEGAGEGGA